MPYREPAARPPADPRRSRCYFVAWHVFGAVVTFPLWIGPFVADVWRR